MELFARPRGTFVVGILFACVVGCTGGDTAPNASSSNRIPALATIVVTLPAASLQVGQTEAAAATGLDQSHSSIATGGITWTSSNPAIASVSATGTITALSPGQTQIVASSGGTTGQAPLTVVAAGALTSLTLSSAGQSTAFLNAPDPRVALSVQPNAQYLIAVVNTGSSPSIREDFTLALTGGGVAAASATQATTTGAAQRSVSAPAPTNVATLNSSAPTPRLPDVSAHLGMLEENRRVFASFGSARTRWARAAAAQVAVRADAVSASAGVVPTIGVVNKVYVKSALTGSCTSVDSIGARTVAVGQHVIVLADTNLTTWPQSLRPDSSFYQSFATEYDQVTWPHIIANVGDPLAFDQNLSGLGKVTVTITPILNSFGGSGGGSVVAFVNACDLFPFAASGSEADLSNQTEMFYSWTPGSNGFDVATWEKGLRATAAHETKHIVSYADRIINDSPVLEEIWLEEGLAQVSSEIWERNFSQATWKGHATFQQTVACELSLGASAPCDLQDDKPVNLVVGHLPFLFQYLQAESASHTEGLGVDTPSNYGAGWSFARWATDQYASSGGEAAFIKSLINEPQLAGLANLSQHTGQSIPTLLVYWNLATGIFQTPTYVASDPRATIPSFNFADIFHTGQTGLTCGGTPCGLFTQSGSPAFPVAPIPLTGAAPQTITSVPGTSAVFFLLSASMATTQQLHLLDGTGAALAPSSGLRVAILRVR